MKEREGNDFYPQQGHHRYRVMMGAVGQAPVLSELAKGVVFYPPARVADVANGRPVIPLQIPGHHPNPVLFFLLGLPLLARSPALGPALPHPHHAHGSGIGIGEAQRRHIPNLYLALASFYNLSWLLPVSQRQRLLVGFITFLLE